MSLGRDVSEVEALDTLRRLGRWREAMRQCEECPTPDGCDACETWREWRAAHRAVELAADALHEREDLDGKQATKLLTFLMREQPLLHADGFAGGPGESKLRELRAELANDGQTVARVMRWLQRIEKRRTINNRHTSYGLKHLAEPWVGYVRNGSFIAAAMLCGFEWAHRRQDGPNVSFAMDQRSIEALKHEKKHARLTGHLSDLRWK